MIFDQLRNFEPTGFYLFDESISDGWEFSLNFFYDTLVFRYPVLILQSSTVPEKTFALQDVTSCQSLKVRFRDLQEAESGSLPSLHPQIKDGLIDNLILLHRKQWEESEKEREAAFGSTHCDGASKTAPVDIS